MNCDVFAPALIILAVMASLLILICAKRAYHEGYDEGYDEGYNDAKEELNQNNDL